jgi:undecaprenyl-diphosphatase
VGREKINNVNRRERGEPREETVWYSSAFSAFSAVKGLKLDYCQALILGIVEGLTEYLPVSSTGHLILAEKLLGLEKSPGLDAFKIVIQVGAILAVVGVFFPRIREMVQGMTGRSSNGLKLSINLIIALGITAGLALAFEKPIKARFFNLTVVSWAWIVGGILMLAVDYWRRRSNRLGKEMAELTWFMAIGIGLCQAMALCPGVSRSLATLVGGLIVGLSLPAALEISFLLGGLTLTAAGGYELLRHWNDIRNAIDPGPMTVAILASTLSAWVTVRWMLRFIQQIGLTPFGVYRIILGAIVLFLIATARLS